MLCNGCPLKQQVGNIRDLEKFVDSLWPWNVFNDCFSNGIRVSDLDGIVERRGQFLVLEGKGYKNGIPVPIPTGQLRMFQAMASTGQFFIYILWGEQPGKPLKYQVIGKVSTEQRDCDIEVIKKAISSWYRWANTRKIK